MMLSTKQFSNSRYIYYNFIFNISFVIFLTTCTFKQQSVTKKTKLVTNTSINDLWVKHRQQLTNITKFQIHGILIYTNQDKKIRTNFFWQQYSVTNYRLLLINNFGTTELKLNVKLNKAELIDQNGKKYMSNYPRKLIFKLIGIKIPIENLSKWLIGLPVNATSFTLYKNGLLKTIEHNQNNEIWQLNYLIYYQNSNQLKLPNTIELTKNRSCIKLKINNWILK